MCREIELTGRCLSRRESEHFSFFEVSGVAFETKKTKRKRKGRRGKGELFVTPQQTKATPRLTKFDDRSNPRESQPPQRARRILRRRSQSSRSLLLFNLVDEPLRNIASVEGERHSDHDELERERDGLGDDGSKREGEGGLERVGEEGEGGGKEDEEGGNELDGVEEEESAHTHTERKKKRRNESEGCRYAEERNTYTDLGRTV